MTTNDSELETFFATRAEAQQSKNIDRLMEHYDPDIVYYDVVPPLRFAGHDEVRRNFLRWFDGYEGPISLQTHDRTVRTSGDVAFANMLHLDSGTRKGGLQASIWVRETVCLHRSNGGWLITHEHISIPINPENLQVWFAADKDQPA
ncbi:YybH family protein [Nocardia suismassiliense]|uniref:YybH family protein n=1 Tax=Nocardia suismassiliense TaxID=2077092 RepID=UPI000D1FA371|nr:nuclear transport factor 2 family protein [Nocardia suismassiliense]